MFYAMILQNRVICVLPNEKIEPYWPPDPEGNPVTAVPCDNTVTLGMMYDAESGVFSKYIPPEPVAPELTPEQEQLDRIEEAVTKTNKEIVATAIADYEAELNAAYTEGVNSL